MSVNKDKKEILINEKDFPVNIKIVPKGTMSKPKTIRIDINGQFIQFFEEVLA